MLVSFIEMASVNENGYIDKKEDRKLGDVIKGGYTYFHENDIIIAKITPCMENGKCAIARGLTNNIGFGSSEFHVFECNDNLNVDFLFGYLNRSSIRKKAAAVMTGASGHRRVPIEFYEDLEIPFLTIEEQSKIVKTVKEFESKIVEAEKKLEALKGKTGEILERYLR